MLQRIGRGWDMTKASGGAQGAPKAAALADLVRV